MDAIPLHFFVIARASAREARYWLLRATARRLIEQDESDRQLGELVIATRMLNALIRYRRSRIDPSVVREDVASYGDSLDLYSDDEDPFTIE